MEQVLLKVKDGQDISFVGQEVAYGHNDENDVAIRIYETEKGNWVTTATSSEGYILHHQVVTNKSVSDIVSILGYGDLAKSIYKQLNIDTVKKLDA
ncbi:hypothetical protein [Pantoea agglomerans]|uniref:hypothetical protein n=1 Tax=Enterobacter agglomerans TaxID=549 RepID=UPI00177ABB34|nr:hypothetical protein [Pantoea agglomerans]MBD8260496.1 hypothetical protein [Pantoea agglomerans]